MRLSNFPYRLSTLAMIAAILAVAFSYAGAEDDQARRIAAHNYLVRLGVRTQAGDITIPKTARLTDADFQKLLEIGRYEGLTCSCTTVTSKGIVDYLSKAEGLLWLNLDGPAVTDDVIAATSRLKGLKLLSLRGPFRGTGFKAVAEGPASDSLTELSLRTEEHPRPDGKIGLAFGLTEEALVAIGSLSQLRHLSLAACGVTDERLKSLSGLKDLEELELDGNPIDGSGLMAFDGFAKLDYIALTFCLVVDRKLTKFPRLPKLRLLKLSGNQLGDGALATIGTAELHALESLFLSRTDVTDDGLRLLRPLKKLHELALSETRVDGKGFSALARSNIRFLRVARTPLNPMALGSLADYPELVALDVGGTQLTDADVPNLLRLRKLVYLNVARTGLSKAGIARLRDRLPDCEIELRDQRRFDVWRLPPGGQPASD